MMCRECEKVNIVGFLTKRIGLQVVVSREKCYIEK